MLGPLNYLIATLKAASFQESVNTHYQNTKGEAAGSLIIILLSLFYCSWLFYKVVLCNLGPCGGSFSQSSAAYVAGFLIISLIAIPKFLIFFGLVWQLCKLFHQTEYFYAFMAANNWFYIAYLPLHTLSIIAAASPDVVLYPQLWPLLITFYLIMVVFFLAHNVLRLRQEIAWIVPMCFLVAHALMRAVIAKSGMLFVF